MRLVKTVIGSLPQRPMPVRKLIRSNLELQLKCGVDIVSDGEPRWNMVVYLKQIPGLSVDPQGAIYVKSRVKPMDSPKEFVKVKDYEYLSSLLEKMGRRDIRIKTAVTGPVTLSFTCGANRLNYYSNLLDKRLYIDMAEALRPLVAELLRRGSMVQIDEPGLSQQMLPPDQAVGLVNRVLKDLPEEAFSEDRLSVHICGGLKTDLLKRLLSLEASVLSLAFSGDAEKGNIDLFDQVDFRNSGRKLGLGCIAVRVARLEDVEAPSMVSKRIRRIAEKIGYKSISYIHPDCGMRATPQDVVERILRNMSDACGMLQSA